MADEDYQERQTPFTEDYPRFVQENDEYAFRFGPIDGAEKEVKKIEDDEGTEIHITLNDDMLVEFRFAQSKIDRVAVRYHDDRDMLYVRLRRYLRQEFSNELDMWDEDIVVDYDKKQRVIGFAILNASSHIDKAVLDVLVPVSQWIPLWSDGRSEDELKSKKERKRDEKAKLKQQRKAAAAEQRKPKRSDAKKGYTLVPRKTPISDIYAKTTYYKQKVVRDLHWVLNCPYVLTQGTGHSVPIAPTDWMKQLDMDSDALLRELDGEKIETFYEWAETKRSTRSNNLGGYFALLLNYWLSRCKNISDITQKYQLFEGRRTIGDMDFLFKDHSKGVWTQWEVGIKFYLLLENQTPETGHEVFVGPHASGDSLRKYIYKTLGQLNARNNEAAKTHLAGEGIWPEDAASFLVGYLFFPITENYWAFTGEATPKTLANWRGPLHSYDDSVFTKHSINPKALFGWWARYTHEFDYDPEKLEETAAISNAVVMSRHVLGMDPAEDDELVQDILRLGTLPNPVKDWKMKNARWVVLNKNDYMSPLLVTEDRMTFDDEGDPNGRSDDKLVVLDYAQLKRAAKYHFSKSYRSMFVAEVIPLEYSNVAAEPNVVGIQYVEVSRGFIVGAFWPFKPKSLASVQRLP